MHALQFRGGDAAGQELTRLALRRVLTGYAPALEVERVEETAWTDFILHAGGRRIGVDVMPMQWKVAKSVSPDERQLTLRRDVVAAAQREFLRLRGPAVEVLVRFDDARPLRGPEVRPLARALRQMVSGMVPGSGELLSMPWPPMHARGESPPILAVAVCRPIIQSRSRFRVAPPPLEYPELLPGDIETALARHAKQHAGRVHREDERWLILLVNTALPSTRCRVFEEPLAAQYRSGLDRLFLLQDVPPALQELHLLHAHPGTTRATTGGQLVGVR